jgi:hypothetical protein
MEPEPKFFGITGVGLSTIRYLTNDGKQPRRGLDAWDRVSSIFLVDTAQ